MIRPARHSDAEQIADIWRPVLETSLATFNPVIKSAGDIVDLIDTRDRDGRAFFVAEEGVTIMGFAHYGQFRAGQGYARTMEHTVILADTAQGRGIGRALMVAIEDHARSRNVHSMIAGVSGHNPAGIRFHAALGYREVARLPEVGFKFGQYLDLVVMQKIL